MVMLPQSSFAMGMYHHGTHSLEAEECPGPRTIDQEQEIGVAFRKTLHCPHLSSTLQKEEYCNGWESEGHVRGLQTRWCFILLVFVHGAVGSFPSP